MTYEYPVKANVENVGKRKRRGGRGEDLYTPRN